MKFNFLKIVFLLGVMFLFTVTFNNEAKAATTTAVKVNVDGVTTSSDAINKDGTVYLPIRSISERFPTTTVAWNQQYQQITLNIKYYREPSKYIISLQDPDGIDYISKVDIKKGNTLKRFGKKRPILINGVTYVALTDIALIYDAKVEWDNKKKTAYVLYKGKGNDRALHKTGFYTAVGFVNEYSYSTKELADQTQLYEFTSKSYDLAEGVANTVKLKPLAKNLSTIGNVFDFLTHPFAAPFKTEHAMFYNYANNNNYLNGVYMEKGTMFFKSIRPQTINDIK